MVSTGSHEEVGRVLRHCRVTFNSLTAYGERLQNAIQQVYPGKTTKAQLRVSLTGKRVACVLSSGSVQHVAVFDQHSFCSCPISASPQQCRIKPVRNLQ